MKHDSKHQRPSFRFIHITSEHPIHIVGIRTRAFHVSGACPHYGHAMVSDGDSAVVARRAETGGTIRTEGCIHEGSPPISPAVRVVLPGSPDAAAAGESLHP